MDVGAWLRGLGLGRYEQPFRDNDVDAEVLPELTADDLIGLGITSVGHRRKLLAAIAALRQGAPFSETRPAPAEPTPPATAPRSPEAERRQLTVMFADLVGSTALSTRLDPEDLRVVIRGYQDAVAGEIARYQGHVAKFMGDGVLAYFGFPRAHENDAERAVRAGLDIVGTVGRLRSPDGAPLGARVGIATGLVVVGDLIGSGPAREQAVVGETPNLAARLQALAEPGAVVVARTTRRLVGGLFECADLGDHPVKGFAEPVRAWRVLGPGRAEGRFEALRGETLTPVVGREHELGLLLDRWELAKRGRGQVVLLTGEPGIGKSRLVQALLERIAAEPHGHLGYQCSPFHLHSAFHPITEQIQRAARVDARDLPEQKAEKLRGLVAQAGEAAAEDLAVLAALLSIPGGERFPEIEPDPEQRKARILATLLRQLEGLAARHPMVGVFEDVHWGDPSTISLLERLVERLPSRRALLLVTCRPEFVPPWTGLAHCTPLLLSRMPASATTELVATVAGGRRLSDGVVRQIVAKTDGVPLFVEELTRAIIESDISEPAAADDAPVPRTASVLAIPATLHDLLMARLDRLAEGRKVAQVGAAIGRSFDYGLLSAVAGRGEEALRAALARLEQAGLLVRRGEPPDSSYSFKHALVRDAAYGTLLRAARQDHHRRIAAALERLSPDLAATDPAFLAHHYIEAGLPEPAVRHLRRAGARAVETAAYAEAVDSLTRALALLADLPDGPERAREEIAILLDLGGAELLALGPWSVQVEQNPYRRALELCERLGTPRERFTALWGLCFPHYTLGDVLRMREHGDELLPMAEQLGDPALLLEAHHVRWGGRLLAGDLRQALHHTEQGLACYDRAAHHALAFAYGGHDPGLCARNLNAVSLCLLGRPEEARRRSAAALGAARELGHSHTLLEGLFNALLVELLVSDVATVERQVAALEELVRAGQVPHHASGPADGFGGWALAERGSVGRGLELMRRGYAVWRSFVTSWCFPLDATLADILGRAGHADEGVRLIDGTLLVAEQRGARWWDAELHRIRAGLLRAAGAPDGPAIETELERAVTTARAGEARWFELRATNDLARLWSERGERRKAYELLTPLYGWFTEGFDTPDLRNAKALIDELG